ncbi:hypothetical protein Anapl_09362 [Anas platyrhynchos]|uniref:Uncharacterized protein n=1 Tax=Anas platyrhynchos TaxID=8839 RepID=R0JY82_ANAPL|nr:hypothetical protein Anapl_09362 [Anas platyrhynchos]
MELFPTSFATKYVRNRRAFSSPTVLIRNHSGITGIQYVQCISICYGKVGGTVAAKAARKQNWLYPSCHKGNPQLTVQTSFPFPLPSRNSTSIVSDSNMDKKNEVSGMKTPRIASRATVPTTKIMTVIKSKHVDLGFTCEIQDAIEDTQRNYLLKLSTRSILPEKRQQSSTIAPVSSAHALPVKRQQLLPLDAVRLTAEDMQKVPYRTL